MRRRYAGMRPIIGPRPASGKGRFARFDEPVMERTDGVIRPFPRDHPGDSKRRRRRARGGDAGLGQRVRSGEHVCVRGIDAGADHAHGRQAVDEPGAPVEPRLQRLSQVRLVVEVLVATPQSVFGRPKYAAAFRRRLAHRAAPAGRRRARRHSAGRCRARWPRRRRRRRARGGLRRTTVPSEEGSGPGSGPLVARA